MGKLIFNNFKMLLTNLYSALSVSCSGSEDKKYFGLNKARISNRGSRAPKKRAGIHI